jgi:uncharacterized membrane protein
MTTEPEKQEKQNDPSPTLKITIVAVYAAACVGAGYLLIFIPNVEIYDMMIFLGGLLFGKRIGVSAAFIAEVIHSIFNVYGASPLPLLVVQLIAYTILGLAGGAMSESKFRKVITKRSQVVFGLIGTTFAFIYTVCADIMFPLFVGGGTSIIGWLIQGTFFRIVLMVCDFITFSSLMPLILVAVEKHIISIFPREQGSS